MSVLSLPAGKGVQKGWSFVPNVSSIWDTQRVMSNDLRDHFPLGTAALQGQSPSLMCMVVFPVPDSAPGIYCVHHKLVALGSRPIRNKTSCCCQVREGKCTLCPEDYRPLLFSRPFLDMVYHALDSPDDDYHALFVLCLLYAMSHNKGRHAPRHLQCLTQCSTVHCLRGRTVWEGVSFLASEVTTTMFFFSHITISQVFFADWSHRHWWLRHGGGKFKCGCLTQWG